MKVDMAMTFRILSIGVATALAAVLMMAGAANANDWPYSPTSLVLTNVAGGVKLTWAVPAETDCITGYQIMSRSYGDNATKVTQYVASTGATARCYLDASVTDGNQQG